MTIPFGEVPEAERDEQIGFWWKDRLELLVVSKFLAGLLLFL